MSLYLHICLICLICLICPSVRLYSMIVSLHPHTYLPRSVQDEERVFAGRKMTRDEIRELEKKKEVLRLAREYNATTVDKSQRCVSV